MTMIALLGDDKYYVGVHDNTREFLLSYAEYIGLDMKIFKTLANSDEWSIKDLVDYINRYGIYDEVIEEIYEIGQKLF